MEGKYVEMGSLNVEERSLKKQVCGMQRSVFGSLTCLFLLIIFVFLDLMIFQLHETVQAMVSSEVEHGTHGGELYCPTQDVAVFQATEFATPNPMEEEPLASALLNMNPSFSGLVYPAAVQAWSGAHLSQKHKAYVAIVQDVVQALHAEGSPIGIHYGIAHQYGATEKEIAALLSFLAPIVSFPLVFAALPGFEGGYCQSNRDFMDNYYESSLGTPSDPQLDDKAKFIEAVLETMEPHFEERSFDAFAHVWADENLSAGSKVVLTLAAYMALGDTARNIEIFEDVYSLASNPLFGVMNEDSLDSLFKISELYIGATRVHVYREVMLPSTTTTTPP